MRSALEQVGCALRGQIAVSPSFRRAISPTAFPALESARSYWHANTSTLVFLSHSSILMERDSVLQRLESLEFLVASPAEEWLGTSFVATGPVESPLEWADDIAQETFACLMRVFRPFLFLSGLELTLWHQAEVLRARVRNLIEAYRKRLRFLNAVVRAGLRGSRSVRRCSFAVVQRPFLTLHGFGRPPRLRLAANGCGISQ